MPPTTSTEVRLEQNRLSGDLHGAPLALPLNQNEVHVFVVPMDERLVKELLPLLSADERGRAEQFLFPRDRHHFIVARGMLRKLIGDCLQYQPDKVEFLYGPKGKPALRVPACHSIRFNLAHSHELAVYAFCKDRELGIDLEFVGREVDYDAIAERFFSFREAAELRSLPAAIKQEAFFNCWTRKEAYIKARGEGFSNGLDQFSVSLKPREVAALLHNERDPQECSRWSIHSLPIENDYMGAIVVEGQVACVKVIKFRI